MSEHEQGIHAERWWPQLSITAKHHLLEDLDGDLDDVVRDEISKITGEEAGDRLGDSDKAFIRTQIEPVD